MTSYVWILLLAALAVSRAQDLNLLDAFDDDDAPTPTPAKPKSGGGEFDLDLSDALGPDTPSDPKKPAGNPTKTGGTDPKKTSGGGGGFGDSDLSDVAGNDEYKPDAGRGGRAQVDDTSDTSGGAEQGGAQTGQMAGILSAVGVAILGAASSYFAYQKKKLCFKIQGGTDPESGTNQSGTHSEPQVLSNLLKQSS